MTQPVAETDYENPPLLQSGPAGGQGLFYDPTTKTWTPGSLAGLEAPTAAVREFMARRDVSLVDFTLTTGVAVGSAVDVAAGDVISSLTIVTGATAGVTLTHSWVALCTVAGKVLAISADGTGALSASAAHTISLATAYTAPVSEELIALYGHAHGGTPGASPSLMVKADGTTTVAGLAPKVAVTVSQVAVPTVGGTLTFAASTHRPYGYTG